jgi:hypothetical protein
VVNTIINYVVTLYKYIRLELYLIMHMRVIIIIIILSVVYSNVSCEDEVTIKRVQELSAPQMHSFPV